jgi:hypothetical protein
VWQSTVRNDLARGGTKLSAWPASTAAHAAGAGAGPGTRTRYDSFFCACLRHETGPGASIGSKRPDHQWLGKS